MITLRRIGIIKKRRRLYYMKLQKMNDKQFFITLPNSIIRAKGWKKGDIIEAKIDGRGNIYLIKRE